MYLVVLLDPDFIVIMSTLIHALRNMMPLAKKVYMGACVGGGATLGAVIQGKCSATRYKMDEYGRAYDCGSSGHEVEMHEYMAGATMGGVLGVMMIPAIPIIGAGIVSGGAICAVLTPFAMLAKYINDGTLTKTIDNQDHSYVCSGCGPLGSRGELCLHCEDDI